MRNTLQKENLSERAVLHLCGNATKIVCLEQAAAGVATCPVDVPNISRILFYGDRPEGAQFTVAQDGLVHFDDIVDAAGGTAFLTATTFGRRRGHPALRKFPVYDPLCYR